MNGALASRTDLVWEPLLGRTGLAFAVAAVVAFLVLSYLSTAGQPAGRRAASIALRLAALAALGVAVAGPTRVTTRGRVLRDPLVILLDDSASMGVAEDGRTRSAAVRAWLKAQEPTLAEWRGRYDLRVRLFGATVQAVPEARAAAALTAGQAGTDLLAALDAALPRPGEPRPAAVVLVSDGADRASLGRAFTREGAAGLARLLPEIGVPVHTVLAGRGGGVTDLSVELHALAPFAFVRRPVEIAVKVEDRGTRTREVPVTLTADGKTLGTRRVAPDPETGEGSARFSFTPERVGWQTLRVEAPVPPSDQVPANNVAEATLKVIRDRTRVLQVSSHPSWDVKFLRKLLKADPNVDLVSFFIMRRSGFGGMYANEELSLIEFPHQDLFGPDLPGFDLVVFQDFAFEPFLGVGAGYNENLAKYVEEGGALVMIGGERSFAEGGYAGTALERVLPAALTGGGPAAAAEFQPHPTADGIRHPVTRLGRDDATTREAWSGLPRLRGWNALGPAHTGGAVLVRVGGPDGSPLVAARQAGKGRTLAVATDSTWRWALAGGATSSRAYARFWQNAVRWLVRDVEQKQVEVLADQENYEVGSKVRLEVRVLGSDYAPLPAAALQGEVVPLAGGTATPFAGLTDASGAFVFETAAPSPGTRRVTVTVPSLPREAGRGEARFSVTEGSGELKDPAARPELLRAISEATSGEAIGLEDGLARLPPLGPANLTATERVAEPLWNRWPFMLAFGASLSADWFLRRRRGML